MSSLTKEHKSLQTFSSKVVLGFWKTSATLGKVKSNNSLSGLKYTLTFTDLYARILVSSATIQVASNAHLSIENMTYNVT